LQRSPAISSGTLPPRTHWPIADREPFTTATRSRTNAKEIVMEKQFLAMTALAVVLGAPMAAQAQGVTVGVAPSSEIVVGAPVGVDADGGIMVEQRPAFREYIVRERVPTYTIRERVIVGGTLPEEGITTYDVPQKFGTTPYRYTVVNGQTVLVEPRSRRIVQVID
jgi:hypothetical protein